MTSFLSVARQYHAWGAAVNAIRRDSKAPLNAWKHLHDQAQAIEELSGYAWSSAGGVGVNNGPGGWHTFDIDPRKDKDGRPVAVVGEGTIAALLAALQLPQDYPWVWRGRSRAGWALAFRCDDPMPQGTLPAKKKEAGVAWGWPEKESGADWDHLELRWAHCQTVYPPSAGYQWRGAAPTEAPALVPIHRVIEAFFALCPPPPQTFGSIDRAVLEQIKRTFDLVAYAAQEFGGETQEERGEVRILGHGGLLVQPEKRIWYCFGGEVGGDCFDLVAYAKYRTHARHLNGKGPEILETAAAFAGVPLPDRKPEQTLDLVPSSEAPTAKPVGRVEYVVADWRSGGITAAELFRKHFDPLIWTVENIIPESTCLLAGKPKSKKSWFALAIACACALGGRALGRLQVRQGRVLYLDLESNQRRAKSRLFSIIGRAMERLTNLHIFTKWPRGADAVQALEEWMAAYPDTVLIVIDVLADFRRGKDPKEDAYLYDRETVGPITEVADRHRISVVMVHHTRKAKADDVFDEISGSTGLISAVGTALILGRAPNGSGEMVLDLRGRDLINDDPLALIWDDYTCTHIIVGGAVDAKLGAERRQVLKVLSDDQPWTPKEIAAELEKPVNNVQQMLKVLLSEGMVERTGRGQYVRVLSRDQNDQNHQNTKNGQDDQIGDSDLHPQDQNQDQNRLARGDAVSRPSDHSDRVSKKHHIDQIGALWRVWNPGHTSLVSVWSTQAEAEAEACRLNGGSDV